MQFGRTIAERIRSEIPMEKPLPQVNLKLIQTFMLVARHSSFRLAAEQSFRSQSAISAQIRQLEDQLGVPLFIRTTRSVRLTPEGEELMERSRRAMHEVESGLRAIAERADARRGRVDLSCSPTIAGGRLAPILAAFDKAFPKVEVSVRELTFQAMYESIRRHEVDFGIGPCVPSGEFDFEVVLEDPLYALVPVALAGGRKQTIGLNALARMPLLMLNYATALRGSLEDAMTQRGLTWRTRYEFGQAHTLIAMAAAGLGAAILPCVALPSHLPDKLRQLRIVNPPMGRQIAIITSRGHKLSPASQKLVQLVRDRFSGHD
ncbi:HTH-type transcriptional regulator GltC [Achromobacter veterisilvae]|uniref:HTH-type transcriptional regulator GltC n=2 Tax=Achromobacter veterisilvae TaxID=2069367 RepID=A0A446CQC1_9BURK|nr:HTH-type transcriptional regulator GltC [Achromobacter veterisilvae]